MATELCSSTLTPTLTTLLTTTTTSFASSADPNGDLDMDSVISDLSCQRLFRLFLLFAGPQLVRYPDPGRLLRFIRPAQVQFLLDQMHHLRDRMQFEPPAVDPGNSPSPATPPDVRLTFRHFLLASLAICPMRHHFEPVVDRMFARYVLQMIRRGFLFGHRLCSSSKSPPADQLARWHRRQKPGLCCNGIKRETKWRPFWCVLVPGQLHLWPLAADLRVEEENLKSGSKTLKLGPETQMEFSEKGEEAEDKKKVRNRHRQQRLFGWRMATPEGIFEFAHFDQLQRQLWIADLELAMRKRSPSLLSRFDRDNSLRHSTPRKSTTPEGTVAKLEAEKRELEERLEAERRALRDEECVRQMATRMLDAEVRKGDSLRRTVQFLARELESEKQHRLMGPDRHAEMVIRSDKEEGEDSDLQKVERDQKTAAEEQSGVDYGNNEKEDKEGYGNDRPVTPFMPVGCGLPIRSAVSPVPKSKRPKKMREKRGEIVQEGGRQTEKEEGRDAEELEQKLEQYRDREAAESKEENAGESSKLMVPPPMMIISTRSV